MAESMQQVQIQGVALHLARHLPNTFEQVKPYAEIAAMLGMEPKIALQFVEACGSLGAAIMALQSGHLDHLSRVGKQAYEAARKLRHS